MKVIHTEGREVLNHQKSRKARMQPIGAEDQELLLEQKPGSGKAWGGIWGGWERPEHRRPWTP